jgi:hypothetical protein
LSTSERACAVCARRFDVVTIALDGERRVAEVEHDQQIAGLDALAFLDADFYDAPGDLRREVNQRCFNAAVEMHLRAIV